MRVCDSLSNITNSIKNCDKVDVAVTVVAFIALGIIAIGALKMGGLIHIGLLGHYGSYGLMAGGGILLFATFVVGIVKKNLKKDVHRPEDTSTSHQGSTSNKTTSTTITQPFIEINSIDKDTINTNDNFAKLPYLKINHLNDLLKNSSIEKGLIRGSLDGIPFLACARKVKNGKLIQIMFNVVDFKLKFPLELKKEKDSSRNNLVLKTFGIQIDAESKKKKGQQTLVTYIDKERFHPEYSKDKGFYLKDEDLITLENTIDFPFSNPSGMLLYDINGLKDDNKTLKEWPHTRQPIDNETLGKIEFFFQLFFK